MDTVKNSIKQGSVEQVASLTCLIEDNEEHGNESSYSLYFLQYILCSPVDSGSFSAICQYSPPTTYSPPLELKPYTDNDPQDVPRLPRSGTPAHPCRYANPHEDGADPTLRKPAKSQIAVRYRPL